MIDGSGASSPIGRPHTWAADQEPAGGHRRKRGGGSILENWDKIKLSALVITGCSTQEGPTD